MPKPVPTSPPVPAASPDCCQGCRVGFTPLRRALTCRKCQQHFCSGCARVRRGPAAGGAVSRVCNRCVLLVGLFHWGGWAGDHAAGIEKVLNLNTALKDEEAAAEEEEAEEEEEEFRDALLNAVKSLDPNLPNHYLTSSSAFSSYLKKLKNVLGADLSSGCRTPAKGYIQSSCVSTLSP